MHYTFASASGSYTALTGGTSWQSGTMTDAVSPAITLPWSFTYNGVVCDRIYISNNGFITLANGTTTTAPTAATYNPISAATGYVSSISGYGFNLVHSPVAGAAPDISYGTSGSDYVVQFTDLGRTGITGDRLSFQIRLTQTTNVVSIVYGTWAATTTTTSVSNFGVVGLRGSANTIFNNRQVTATAPYNTWAASGAGADNGTAASQSPGVINAANGANCMRYNSTYLPVSGLTYTWTPVGSSFYRSLPYTQNFESWSNLFAVKDNPGSGILTLPATGNASWRNYNETTANSLWSSSFGAVVLTAAQGSGAASFYNYGTKAGNIGFMDFYLDLSVSGAKTLTFDLINKDPGTLALQLSTDGGVTFSTLTGYTTTAVAAWATQTVSLGSSTSSTCILRFRATSTYNSNNIGIDNISVSIISCPGPTALSATTTSTSSTNLSWTAAFPAPASGYEYFVSATNTAPASTATPTGTVATGTSVTASGLTANTTYYYWVRSVCSVSDKSTWTSGGIFKTAFDLCGQSFYDSGGSAGNYVNNENITTVICPTNSTQLLNVTFNSFSTESGSDFLKIYRGVGITGTALHTGSGFSGTTSPGTISGNTAGTCLTFLFTSDASIISTGWDASVSCLSPCSGAPTAGTITPSRNPLCSGVATTLTLSGATAGIGITYQWKSSATAGGPYTNLGTSLTQATGNLTATMYYVCDVVCTVTNTTATAAEVTVTVNPNPTITTTSSASQYCGTPLTLNASGANTYSWSPSTNLSASTGASVTAILTANRNYTVVGTVTATGCTATSAALPLTLGNVITVSSITATPNSVCSGTTSNLSVVATSPQTVNLYTFASSTGASLESMTSATSLIATGIDNSASSLVTFPSGFVFPYEGVNYTQFSANSNGVLRLGGTLVSTSQYGSIIGQTLLLTPAGADMGTGSDGSVSYLLTGPHLIEF